MRFIFYASVAPIFWDGPLEPFHEGPYERLDQVENQVAGPRATNQRHAPNPRPQHPIYNEYLEDPSDGEEYEDIRPRRLNRPRDRPRRPSEEDGGLGGVKMHKEWIRNGKRPITIMRRRFVPSYYRRELHNHLQHLTQGSKSVDEYYKEMEIAINRTNIMEDNEATMAHFLHGLNWNIADIVEMHHYVELEEMVHQAIKVEQQLKRRGFVRRTSNSSRFGQWKNNPKKTPLLHQNSRRRILNMVKKLLPKRYNPNLISQETMI
ncbi:UNVERIFIED_CONTAM: hypothetical protein Slati_3070400 [Sesamum latifolium]|uniref:Retrotransposon gag domain-containing protein n=1 Tax=Sesamum latifolium TaxID=2727402 RepID=A0AAW2USW9_9LAMI